jgi:hypothetical protein
MTAGPMPAFISLLVIDSVGGERGRTAEETQKTASRRGADLLLLASRVMTVLLVNKNRCSYITTMYKGSKRFFLPTSLSQQN